MTEKLKQEVNPLSEVVQQVAKICPAAVQDGKIDFERLRTEWSADLIEPDVESYNFTWVGKNAAIAEANKKIRKTLRPVKADSKNWENTQNLYIEGDNLDVLKLLQESYLGKVKMIYIDPPYNTGNDFVYCDDFTLGCEEYIEKKGQCDIETNERLFRNTETNGRFHSDWCSMIYPRLKIARDLLSDDGVIFISIDDNEQANLKKICDEVFGENNFISKLVIETGEVFGTKAAHADKTFVKVKDYILLYAKEKRYVVDKSILYDKMREEYDPHFNTIIKDDFSKLTLSDFIKENKVINDIFVSLGLSINATNINLLMKFSKNFKDWMYNKVAKILFADAPFSKKIPDSVLLDKEPGVPFYFEDKLVCKTKTGSIRMFISFFDNLRLSDDFVPEYTRCSIRGDLWKNFHFDMRNVQDEGDMDFKNGKKPCRLIKQLIKWFNKSDGFFLDFFSGSATTAHAVMQLNAEDGGNRKFIMVQLPEATDEKSEAYKAGYKNICEIGKERIRRAGDKIMSEHPDAKIDTGFRVFRLDDTNMKDIYYKPVDTAQDSLLDMVDNIKPDRTDMDLLFGAMLERGLMLDMPVEEVQSNGITYYVVNNGDLIACFAENIPESVIHEIANRRPLQALFRDSSFAESKDKINLTEIFKNVDSNIKVCVL